MDTKELKEKKHQAEIKISNLLFELLKDTGVKEVSVKVITTRSIGGLITNINTYIDLTL